MLARALLGSGPPWIGDSTMTAAWREVDEGSMVAWTTSEGGYSGTRQRWRLGFSLLFVRATSALLQRLSSNPTPPDGAGRLGSPVGAAGGGCTGARGSQQRNCSLQHKAAMAMAFSVAVARRVARVGSQWMRPARFVPAGPTIGREASSGVSCGGACSAVARDPILDETLTTARASCLSSF